MQNVANSRLIGLALAAMLTFGAAAGTTVVFESASPGSNLDPVGDAGSVVKLIQDGHGLLWTTLGGVVTSYEVRGWPSVGDDSELGGAFMIDRPTGDDSTGIIDIGEKPMSLEFEVTS